MWMTLGWTGGVKTVRGGVKEPRTVSLTVPVDERVTDTWALA